jgi:hypothetical protein
MKFSRASERLAVDDSIYWGAHNRACALKEAGEDIILFSIGDPDLPTLDFIVDHAASSLKSGRTCSWRITNLSEESDTLFVKVVVASLYAATPMSSAFFSGFSQTCSGRFQSLIFRDQRFGFIILAAS